ncbi:MAG: NADPH-dependent FMN reductase [Pseudomonadota bacterium]
MSDNPFIVGIGGTTRRDSTTERALRLALAACARRGAETYAIVGDDMPPDPYDPQRAERSHQAQALVEACRKADGIVIATPSYHGGISGLIKNAIDYVEDLRDDARPYFDQRAVGLIVSAAGTQQLGSTMTSLRTIVHALRGWPTPYSAQINSSNSPFHQDGSTKDQTVADALDLIAEQVMMFAEMVRQRS